MNAGVHRVPQLLEKLFPTILWGHQDRRDGPVYLTFDDGPHPRFTLPLLDCLDRHKVPAAFFLRGNRISGSREITEAIISRGHVTGYHGFHHLSWWFKRGLRRSVEMNPERLQMNVSALFAEKPLLLRPPFGRFDLAVIHTAEAMGAKLVNFRLTIGDWLKGKTVKMLADDLLEKIRPGDIVVLHDGGRNGGLLPEVLDVALPVMRERGLKFGSIRDPETGVGS